MNKILLQTKLKTNYFNQFSMFTNSKKAEADR